MFSESITLLILAGTAAVVIIYCLVVFGSVAFKNPPPAFTGALGELPAVSVVIASRNEAERLPKLLDTLLEQSHLSFEILVVDDRSYDDSYDILLDYQTRYPEKIRHLRVDHVPDHLDSKKYAVTLGIKGAKNDIILLTDADCLPKSNDWIKSFAEVYASSPDTQVVIGVGQYFKQSGALNTFIRFETILTALHYIGFAYLGFPYMGIGRNLSYRKSLFLSHKGFNKIQDIVGGDDDLFINHYAKGKFTKVLVSEESQTYSEPKLLWTEWVRQKERHLSVGKYYNLASKIFTALFNVGLIFHYAFFVLAMLLNFNSDLMLWPIYIFLGRLIITWLFIGLGNAKLKGNAPIFNYPLLEMSFILYYIVFGFKTITSTNRIKWK